MAFSCGYEMGKVINMQWALDLRSASGGLKSLSILKAGLLMKGYLSISQGAV
jgi:hypothetical protein